MARQPNQPLRALSDQERECLLSVSRSYNEPAAHVARAKALLAVADGCSFSEAARRAGRRSGDAVGQLVRRFNRSGLTVRETRHGGGRQPLYRDKARQRILQECSRAPERAADGTATWSLSLLRDALRKAGDGLPHVSTYTIWVLLHAAGYTWQRDRTWCRTGAVLRKRKAGVIRVQDPDHQAKKSSLSAPTPSERAWD
jgi:transposase